MPVCQSHVSLVVLSFIAAVRRKLGFLDIDGYDIFGKNELFAPRIKWEELKNNAESLKKAAMDYEQAYNDIRTTIENSNNFERVSGKITCRVR